MSAAIATDRVPRTYNRSAVIREHLITHGACTSTEICDALNIRDSYNRAVVRATLRAMVGNGILAKIGQTAPYSYSVLRIPAPAPDSTLAAIRRKQRSDAKANTAYRNSREAYAQWLRDTASDPRSTAARIRDALKQVDTMTASEIYAAIGLDPSVGRVRIYSLIHGLVRDGMLQSIAGNPFRYRYLREPHTGPRKPRDPAEVTARTNRRRAALLAADPQHFEKLQAKQDAIAAKKAARLERIAARERAYEQRQRKQKLKATASAEKRAARERQRVLAQTAKALGRPPRKAPPQATTSPPGETIAQWMARTGKAPEVLPHNFDDPITTFSRRRPSISARNLGARE
ncbi:MAG: hypothetical protein ACOH1V_02460 [Stenotrophomonas sp.]